MNKEKITKTSVPSIPSKTKEELAAIIARLKNNKLKSAIVHLPDSYNVADVVNARNVLNRLVSKAGKELEIKSIKLAPRRSCE